MKAGIAIAVVGVAILVAAVLSLVISPGVAEHPFETWGVVLPDPDADFSWERPDVAASWFLEADGLGFVKVSGENWEPGRFVSALALEQELVLKARKGAKLPNGKEVSAGTVSRYLGSIGPKLAGDRRTRGLKTVVSGEAQALRFVSGAAHEDLKKALEQVLPAVFESSVEEKVEIVLTPAEGDAKNLLLLNLELFRKEKPGGAEVRHLFRDPLVFAERDGKIVMRGAGHPGRILTMLSRPWLGKDPPFEADPSAVGPCLEPGPFGKEAVDRFKTGGAVVLATDPPDGTFRFHVFKPVSVISVFNVRREKTRHKSVRERLGGKQSDLSDLVIDVVCEAGDGPARREAAKLVSQWGARGAAVGYFILERNEFWERVARHDFDVLVRTVGKEFFEDPYPYWHSRGALNWSGHTLAAVDSLTAELDRRVSLEGRRRILSEIRKLVEGDGVVRVLYEGELQACGGRDVVSRLAKALGHLPK